MQEETRKVHEAKSIMFICIFHCLLTAQHMLLLCTPQPNATSRQHESSGPLTTNTTWCRRTMPMSTATSCQTPPPKLTITTAWRWRVGRQEVYERGLRSSRRPGRWWAPVGATRTRGEGPIDDEAAWIPHATLFPSILYPQSARHHQWGGVDPTSSFIPIHPSFLQHQRWGWCWIYMLLPSFTTPQCEGGFSPPVAMTTMVGWRTNHMLPCPSSLTPQWKGGHSLPQRLASSGIWVTHHPPSTLFTPLTMGGLSSCSSHAHLLHCWWHSHWQCWCNCCPCTACPPSPLMWLCCPYLCVN